MKRNIYLKKKSLEEAREIVSSEIVSLIHLQTERIPVIRSVGRVIAEPLFAKISSPPLPMRSVGWNCGECRKHLWGDRGGPKIYPDQ